MPAALDPIRYVVAMPAPASHELHVTMTIPALAHRQALDLTFPAWAPGSYLVRDFARHVYDLHVTDDRGRPLRPQRLDKQRWRVDSGGRAVRVRYVVFAFERSVRTSFLDDSHAFWNGTSVFFFVEGELGRSCLVEVEPPSGRRWHVTTALPEISSRRYRAANFDELADSPVEVGTHAVHRFRAGGTLFEVALHGRTNADVPRLLRDLKKIVSATGAIFGGFPFDRYVFIIHALPTRGGGLEHAASTTLDIAGLSFEDEGGYQAFYELAAHEFFHAWNVKRIRDRVLGPFDYTRENYTRLLWFHEGFTEYMEAVILLRAGLLSPRGYLSDLGEDWSRYVGRPGRNVTPLSELSFEAWIKQYRPADNHHNRMVSYYEKGKWAALVLELLMREATSGRRGVAELFKRLWRDFGRKRRPITDSDIQATASALAGRSMRPFFTRYIHGSVELPVPALLRRAGISVTTPRPWDGENDAVKARRSRAWTGLTFAAGGADRATVRTLAPGSPGFRAGLTFGDEIVAVAGCRVNAGSVVRRFADHRPGARVRVSFFRQDLLGEVTIVLGSSPNRRLELALDPQPKAEARKIRRGWLGE